MFARNLRLNPRNAGLSLLAAGVIGALAISLQSPATADDLTGATFFSEMVTNNTSMTQTSVTLKLDGDQTGIVVALPGYSVAPDSGNTLLTYSGLNVADGGTATIGYAINGGTFGISGMTGPGSADIDALYWGPSSTDEPSATIDVSTSTPVTSPYKYIVINATVGSGDQEWVEIPVAQSDPPSIDVADFGPGLTLSDVQYFISPTQIPLDNLDYGYVPPPDSPWQSVPGIPDGTHLDSMTGVQSPEPPHSVALLSLAGMGLIASMWRRRRQLR